MTTTAPIETWMGADTETHRIAHKKLAPPLVCITAAVGQYPNMDTEIVSVLKPETIDGMIDILFDPGVVSVWHNFAYDGAVLCAHRPDLIPRIFQALEEGRIKCTRIREKLLAVSTTGNIDFANAEDVEEDDEFGGDDDEGAEPKGIPLKYSLSELVMKYRGIDISSSKKGDDAWRLNFDMLAPIPLEEWPKEATDYAIEDAIWALDVAYFQEGRRNDIIRDRGFDPLCTEAFRVANDFAFRIVSCRGIATDADWFDKIFLHVEAELAPEKHSLLTDTGILRPGESPRQHKKNPGKFTAGTKESINKKVLHAFIEKLAADFPDAVKLVRTKKTTKFPEGQISTAKGWMADHAHLSPVLQQFDHRNKLQKLKTTELPRLCLKDEAGELTEVADVVHPLFDILKRTGRTSSYADKNIPSFNVQNVSGKDIPVRGILVPRPGYLMYSVDYSYMELCTFAQKCLDLFGTSKLAEIINSGADPHAWLGSQLILRLDPEFTTQILEPSKIDATNSDEVYQAFMALKKCGSPEWEKAFKKWRTFAKPTGLGYPGGLGPKTFVAYAKATYGVTVTLDEATQLRDAWREAIPEAAPYFEWVNGCIDPWNRPKIKEMEDGSKREVKMFAYTSPFGMYRAGCDYCAVANGASLQTPSAEGALTAWFAHVRATYDVTMNSPIYQTTFPLAFIHDEILGEVLDCPEAHDYLEEVARIMVEGFKVVTPDINIKAQPVLMRRWDKAAEPRFDANGRLVPWEPPTGK